MPSSKAAFSISSSTWCRRQEVSTRPSHCSRVNLAVLTCRTCFRRTANPNSTRCMNIVCFAGETTSTLFHQGVLPRPALPMSHLEFFIVSIEKAGRAAKLSFQNTQGFNRSRHMTCPEHDQVCAWRWRLIKRRTSGQVPKIKAWVWGSWLISD